MFGVERWRHNDEIKVRASKRSVLESYLEDGFKIKDIASLLSVSESTVYRRMGGYGLCAVAEFTEITEGDLDNNVVEEITREYPSKNETP